MPEPSITYQAASEDQALLMDLALGLMDLCAEKGGKLHVKRGDTALKVTAQRAQIRTRDGWETIVATDDQGRRVAPEGL